MEETANFTLRTFMFFSSKIHISMSISSHVVIEDLVADSNLTLDLYSVLLLALTCLL